MNYLLNNILKFIYYLLKTVSYKNDLNYFKHNIKNPKIKNNIFEINSIIIIVHRRDRHY